MKHAAYVAAFAMVIGCGVGPNSDPGEAIDPSGDLAPDPSAPTAPGAPGGSANAPAAPDPGTSQQPAGTTPPSQSAGAFAGAPAYMEKIGPSTIDTSGKGNGHLSFNAQGNPAGRACLSCHDGGGKGGAPGFLFAGTLYADAAATKPAVGAEVRVLGADGQGLSAYTDANGNFFFRASAGVTKVPATAGARNATTARSMANKINDGNCNQCHDATRRLSL